MVEWFTDFQVAAHDSELSRCEGGVQCAAYAQGGAVRTEQDLCHVGDQLVRRVAHGRPSCTRRFTVCRPLVTRAPPCRKLWVRTEDGRGVGCVMPGTSYPVVTRRRAKLRD